jgi:hypothetical protein
MNRLYAERCYGDLSRRPGRADVLIEAHHDRVSWATAIEISLGTVQAVATLAALYFAWRTVGISRDTEREATSERFSRRLNEVAELVAEVGVQMGGTNTTLAEPLQVRLRALLAGVLTHEEVPLTFELADAPMMTYEEMGAGYALSKRALDELREVAESRYKIIRVPPLVHDRSVGGGPS